MCPVFDEPQELRALSLANLQLGAGEHFAVLVENRLGDVPASRLCEREHDHRALQAVRFQGRRHDDVRVEHQPERDHPRLGFLPRAAAIA
jgi:hypothetical protein